MASIRKLILVVSFAAVGCAIPTTGVVPRGENVYTVTRQGAGAWVATDQLRSAAHLEASEFCVKRGQGLKVLHTKEIPAGPFGRWPEAEVVFRCD